ncbi:lambda-exonuclease family protein [Intrasporangium flavum]|uniref:lambda-exonuclease family protein n=1 Tax=Intrasporangium flavum TaxID=1428657 RepID=UPI00096CD214|nr:YqaJ viral recombinase family protein [Intrasporangium flavum]
MTATLIPTLAPGSPEWAKRMSASKIAGVVGHSPYESRFSLWHKMTGNLAWDDGQNADEKRRGHYLEPALRQWFRDQHPDMRVERTGTWERDLFPWQVASPDALVDVDDLLECKTSTKDWEWGEPGTSEVPVYYDDQAQWTLLVTGRRRCYFSVLTSFMEFREYVVDADPQKQAWLVTEAEAFMDSLGRHVPSIDEHDATYRAIRQLHPDIEDTEVEIDLSLALEYAAAKAAKDDAETAYRGAAARISDELGTGRVAKTPTGLTVAYRRAGRAGSTPYLNPARGLTAALLTERTAS